MNSQHLFGGALRARAAGTSPGAARAPCGASSRGGAAIPRLPSRPCPTAPSVPEEEPTALALHVSSFSGLGGWPLMGVRQTVLSPDTSCYSDARGAVTPGKEAQFVSRSLQTFKHHFCHHLPIKM